jgi:hypothetical protein
MNATSIRIRRRSGRRAGPGRWRGPGATLPGGGSTPSRGPLTTAAGEPEPGAVRHQHVQHVIGQDPAQGPFLFVNHHHPRVPGFDQPLRDLIQARVGRDGHRPGRPDQVIHCRFRVGEEQLGHRHVVKQLPVLPEHEDAGQVLVMLPVRPQPVPDLHDRLSWGRRDQDGGHDPACGPLAVAQQGRHPLAGLGRHRGQQLLLLAWVQVAQPVGSLVRLHPAQQPRSARGVGLAQQLHELLFLHLLQGVRRLLRRQLAEEVLPLGAAQVLQQVSQLARPQPLQAASPCLQGAARSVLRPEAGDAGPVDDLLRGRPGPEPRRAEPSQQGVEPDVHAHQLHDIRNPCQVQV